MQQLSFQFVSDVHLDCFQPSDVAKWPKIPRLAPLLILAGDVGRVNQPHYMVYLRQLCETYDRVILVPGNHEYYQASKPIHTFSETEELLSSLNIPNLIVLQKGSIVINGIRFIGCTLWSNVDVDNTDVRMGMSDYYKIYTDKDEKDITKRSWKKMNPEFVKDKHQDHVRFLEDAIRSSKEPVVVVTHHCPTNRHLLIRKGNSSVYSCYATPLDITCPKLFERPVIAWISGHSHRTMNEYIDSASDGNRVLLLMNACGYPSEKIPEYNPSRVAIVSKDGDTYSIESFTQL